MYAAVRSICWRTGYRVANWTLQCLADLKACKQTNIPIYSFTEHQRLDETKYLYGARPILW
jgi:uridine kinase